MLNTLNQFKECMRYCAGARSCLCCKCSHSCSVGVLTIKGSSETTTRVFCCKISIDCLIAPCAACQAADQPYVTSFFCSLTVWPLQEHRHAAMWTTRAAAPTHFLLRHSHTVWPSQGHRHAAVTKRAAASAMALKCQAAREVSKGEALLQRCWMKYR